ncbi:MAG: ABC transporter substrate-binding protein [Planctomycetota bacterium]
MAEIRDGRSIYVDNPRFLQPGRPVIKQVVEQVVPTTADRLRALQNGDVDMIAVIPPTHQQLAQSIPNVRLVSQSLPRMHVIQFNLERRELRHRALRRAMDYAIDRAAICSGVGIVLDERNRLVTGPLPFGSFGYNAKVDPRPYDPYLAASLVKGVRKEMQTLPPLKIAHSGDETSRAACERVVASWKRVGLNVSMVDLDNDPTQSPFDADLLYQSYTVSDPIYDTNTLLTRDNPTLAEQGTPWFRQRLVELIDIPNLAAASTLLPEIHRLIHEDAVLLPLGQWTEHFAVGPTVTGVEPSPPSIYHGIVQWNVSLRFPESHWSSKVATSR